jgi:potassium uptake TrkH family protein
MNHIKPFFNIPFYKYVNKVTFILSLISIFVIIYDLGFVQSPIFQKSIDKLYTSVLILGFTAIVLRYLHKDSFPGAKVFIYDGFIIIFILLIFISRKSGSESVLIHFLKSGFIFRLAVFLTFIREYSTLSFTFKRTFLTPLQLLIFSFLFVILAGAFLLMLPRSTYNGISFIDALFTSTSAVCVTGLVVVDTATHFTLFGQIIILILIQIGGLGILTFAGYFAYFFQGGSSYENRLVMGDMANSKYLGDVFILLKRVILITAIIETIGALLIFFSIQKEAFTGFFDRFFFSVFHSISAFCNAGFSTLTDNLYETGYRHNYSLHLIIIFLLVFGGLGFPIVSNIVKYVKYLIIHRFFRISKSKIKYIPWVLNLNSRIVLITTFSLIIFGTVLLYITEYHNTLSDHGTFGKIVESLFNSTTPRTAGFNTVDMAALNFSSVLLIIFLMWIGASPASTGGGIKTSTFAVALLNFISLAKGKTRLELYRREVTDLSVRRAFATIVLSLIVLGTGIFAISIFDGEKGLRSIAFESFSAYSTVGLSLGITAFLTSGSKLTLILLMFIGRISTLSLLMAFTKKEKYKNYRYPSEEVIVN